MIKKIILAVMFTASISVKAQYYILPSEVVLPSLNLEDNLLKEQLDSILFIAHPCEESGYKLERDYTYFVSIREETHGNYVIDIVYNKPFVVESDVNTGIYKMRDVIMVIREDSEMPLFKPTRNKETFRYNRELISWDGKKLTDFLSPEEFCIWGLYYSEGKLKIIELEQVKDAHKYRHVPPGVFKLDIK